MELLQTENPQKKNVHLRRRNYAIKRRKFAIKRRKFFRMVFEGFQTN